MKRIPPLSFPNGNKKSYGIIEVFLSSLVFFSPNFFLFFDFFRENLWAFMFYDYIIIFLVLTALVNNKYKN